MKDKKVFLDFDATLADFGNYWVKYLNEVIPNFDLRLYDIETYNQQIHSDTDLVREFWEKEEHYCKMELLDGAYDFVQKLLSENYDVKIVTSTPSQAIYFKDKFIREKLDLNKDQIIHVTNACLKFMYTKDGVLVDDFILPVLNHVFSNKSSGVVFNFNGQHPWADVNLNNRRYAEAIYKINSEHLYYLTSYDQVYKLISTLNGD